MDIQSISFDSQKELFPPMTSDVHIKFNNDERILDGQFINQNQQAVELMITTNTMTYCRRQSQGLKHRGAAVIDFDLRFEIIYKEEKNVNSKKIGFTLLTKNNVAMSFYTQNNAIAEEWNRILAKKLNQKGFHEMFKPIKKLGKGNFASVYEVERVTDKKKFAVKAFSKANAFSGKNGRESLINEINIMRELDHENLLLLESVYESENSIYVVMGLLTGGQLFHKIQQNRGRFSEDEIRVFMYGLLNGLAQMHKRRIMHRDLKPQNIMLKNPFSMSPVIVDFGLATFADIDQYLFFRCGTPGYVAPEIIELTENKHVEPSCDMFSAGVIFHILLTRKPLFEGVKYEEVYKRNKQMDFNLKSSAYSGIDRKAMELLESMLVKDTNGRISAEAALRHPYFTQMEQDATEFQIKVPNSPQLTQSSSNGKVSNFFRRL